MSIDKQSAGSKVRRSSLSSQGKNSGARQVIDEEVKISEVIDEEEPNPLEQAVIESEINSIKSEDASPN